MNFVFTRAECVCSISFIGTVQYQLCNCKRTRKKLYFLVSSAEYYGINLFININTYLFYFFFTLSYFIANRDYNFPFKMYFCVLDGFKNSIPTNPKGYEASAEKGKITESSFFKCEYPKQSQMNCIRKYTETYFMFVLYINSRHIICQKLLKR